MRFNNNAEMTGGIGDAMASVGFLNTPNSAAIVFSTGPDFHPNSGGTCWWDDDHIMYQTYDHTDGHPILERCNVRTGKKTRMSDIGANSLIAQGGRFAAWLDGTGVFGDLGSLPAATVLESGRDGTLALVPVYQDGTGFTLYGPDGHVTEGPNEVALGLFVIGPTSAIWTNTRGALRTLNYRVPKQIGPAGRTRIATVNGQDWICYWCGDVGLVAHPVDDASAGYILETQGHAFNHDIIGFNGKLHVCFSLHQGEHSGDFIRMVVDVEREVRTPFDGTYIPPKPADGSEFTATTGGRTSEGKKESDIIKPQLGLLEDDIVYRLSLLATNILEPLKKVYPNIVIKSGFRVTNSGNSQHEKGEAVDIQIANQTPELLYEIANYIQNNLAFDQLVLCFSNVGDKQPWIHVSFSPTSLRYQVLTKDFDDTFHDGLLFIDPLSGEEAAAKSREMAALDAQIFSELEKIQKRAARLDPIAAVQDEQPKAAAVPSTGTGGGSGTGGTGGSGGTGSGGNNPTGRSGVVACVQKALGLPGTPEDSQDNVIAAFETVKRVAWLLKDEGCGLLIGPQGGENIVFWNGYYFRAGRVCYADGQIYKILTAVENGPQQGGHAPGWVDDGIVEQDKYVPAMDPGSDINLNWLTCPIPTANT